MCPPTRFCVLSPKSVLRAKSIFCPNLGQVGTSWDSQVYETKRLSMVSHCPSFLQFFRVWRPAVIKLSKISGSCVQKPTRYFTTSAQMEPYFIYGTKNGQIISLVNDPLPQAFHKNTHIRIDMTQWQRPGLNINPVLPSIRAKPQGARELREERCNGVRRARCETEV